MSVPPGLVHSQTYSFLQEANKVPVIRIDKIREDFMAIFFDWYNHAVSNLLPAGFCSDDYFDSFLTTTCPVKPA